jgi:hypothetical protein
MFRDKQQSASFSMKSSHKFVNAAVEDETESNSAGMYMYSTMAAKTPKTESETQRREGSAQGMAMRTSDLASEDFY